MVGSGWTLCKGPAIVDQDSLGSHICLSMFVEQICATLSQASSRHAAGVGQTEALELLGGASPARYANM